jgi:hypothetical protein
VKIRRAQIREQQNSHVEYGLEVEEALTAAVKGAVYETRKKTSKAVMNRIVEMEQEHLQRGFSTGGLLGTGTLGGASGTGGGAGGGSTSAAASAKGSGSNQRGGKAVAAASTRSPSSPPSASASTSPRLGRAAGGAPHGSAADAKVSVSSSEIAEAKGGLSSDSTNEKLGSYLFINNKTISMLMIWWKHACSVISIRPR